MTHYQTFPGIAGDSRSLDKLRALGLPSLRGKRFLDIGCNEGFFCGYAQFSGAAMSVGLDKSRDFIERARLRFPDSEFLHQGWEQLPDGPWDVILLASALHYADDQPALLKRLTELLAPDGVLVVEMGIASSSEAQWVKVKRGIDERYFPTMGMVRRVLDDYAWKWMGPSVLQDGDPVKRHVIHVQLRRPMAYLLMQPPGYGKSTIARTLFVPASIPVISGDAMLHDLAHGAVEASDQLVDAVSRDFSTMAIDRAIKRVCEDGQLGQLVDLWQARADGASFALDGYVPVEYHALVEQLLTERGYLPISLRWNRNGPAPRSEAAVQEQALAYYAFLADGETAAAHPPGKAFQGILGFVDEISFAEGRMTCRGWAVHESGAMPDVLGLRLGGQSSLIEDFYREQRPDVQAYLGLSHDVCGFRFSIPAPQGMPAGEMTLELSGGNDEAHLTGPFPLSKKVAALLTERNGT